MAKKKRTTRPKAGDAFAFPLEDGRYSVCRVLGMQSDGPGLLVAASNWIGDDVPAADDPALRPILELDHHLHYGRPLLLWVSERLPREFIHIGTIKPSDEEKQLTCSSHGDWDSITCQPLIQWRWDHDREQLLADELLEDERETQLEITAQQRRQEYLKHVTLEELTQERSFENWQGHFEPVAIRKARKIMRDTARRLLKLGKDASEQDRVSALRGCIESFNKLDAEFEFIDTEARMDIYAEFEAIAHASKLTENVDSLFNLARF